MARNLSDWLDSFMEMTDNSEPPYLFRKWAGISTIASALQRKVRVELGLSLTFYPNLYVVLVGPSATGKGTAMKFASDIIEQVPTIRLSAQATSLQALIRRMKETNLTDVNVETGEQTYHSSLTIFSTEFTVFLGYHNQELIAALCEWYDCHNRWTYETIARKKEEVVGVWVNLFAGTTPDAIQASLPIESIGGGLTSRIIFVVEEKRGKLVVVPTKTEKEMRLQQQLVYDLEAINRLSGIMQYTEGFLKIYSDWCYYADGHRPFQDRKFDGYCGRRRKHLITLAMICCASHSDEMIMTSEDIDRAIALLAEVEIKMGKVFKGMGRSGTADLLNDAVTFIANSAVPDIPLFQFARYFEGDMDKIEMDRVITTLEAMNLIKIIKTPGVGITLHIIGFEK
jgi:energy-coupling factor transporter ATP-binding protein EcfA2